jgi:hypothetical protein
VEVEEDLVEQREPVVAEEQVVLDPAEVAEAQELREVPVDVEEMD